MKHLKSGSVAFLILALALAGCTKKTAEQASLSGTGFDSLSTSEELAQLPQAGGSTTQQAGVEVLPVESSPVTQGVPLAPGATPTTAAELKAEAQQAPAAAVETAANLTREQQIQQALKNAGLYNGNIDGKIGPASKKAIEAFQKQNGLKVDGKVGPKTWMALEHYLNGQAQAAGASAAGATASTDQN
jgi:peptidoglycan hydrolase-like protein with peptidoglycan-binding domain